MTYIDFGKELVEQGWQCPVCKRIYAPSTSMCLYCGGNMKAKTTTGISIDDMEDFTTTSSYKVLKIRLDSATGDSSCNL